jgi:hypothetical protein
VRRVAGTEVYVVNFDLGAGARITGRVVAADGGAPIAGAGVALTPGSGWAAILGDRSWPPSFPPLPRLTVEAVSGPDGSFAIETLAPGEYSVETEVPGFARAKQQVTLPMSEPVVLRVVAEQALAPTPK